MTASAESSIKWLSFVHNFGAFSEDQGIVDCEFRFVNTGDTPLAVLSARASCGCTQPVYPRESIAPGDTAAIKVAYNPQGRPGRFRKTVSVETSASSDKTKLTIEGVVIGSSESVAGQYPVDRGAMKFRHGSVMFGSIDKPRLKTVYETAYNQSGDSLSLRVMCKPAYIDVNFEPAVVGPGEQATVICFIRTAGDLWGLVEDSIMIAAGAEEFALPFTAMLKEDFSSLSDAQRAHAPHASLSVTSLDFGRINRSDKPVEMSAELTNTGESTLEVRRVYSADRGVTVAIDRKSIKKGKSASITVTVDPAQITGGMLNAVLSVITNDPDNPVQKIRLLAEL